MGASGTSGNPITIAVDATNGNHNGLVIFDYNYLGDEASIYTAISCRRDYVTFSGDVGGQNHIAIVNLRNIMNRYLAYGIGSESTTGVIFDHIASTNCNNPIRLTSATKFRVRNCSLRGVRGDACLSAGSCTGGWDANLVYSNVFEVLCNSAVPPGKTTVYVGADGVQCSDGISIYGNVFSARKGSVYTSDQHPDMIQAVGNYIKVYGNEFINVGDSVFDYDCYANKNPHDVWFYNNLCRIQDDVDIYPEYFRFYCSMNSIATIVNFKIWNNTFADDNNLYRVIRFDNFQANPTATGIEIKNNIFYNCGGSRSDQQVIYIESSSGFTSNSFAFDGNLYFHPNNQAYINFFGTNYSASTWIRNREPHGTTNASAFMNYAYHSSSNNFHLSTSDTATKDHGVPLDAYFAIDKDGIRRPQGSGWDIGAYEFISTNLYQVPSPPQNLRMTVGP